MLDVTLYVEAFWLSPWSCTCYVALREKQVEFTTSNSMLHHGIGATAALRERTLTGTAPVLQHGAFLVAESLAIIEYLEEAFPPPQWPRILPTDLRDRARARQLVSWIRTSHDALRRERPTELIFYPPKERTPLSAAAQRTADDLVFTAERLGAGASGCLFGGTFGIVDVDMAFALMRTIAAGATVPDAIAAYVASVWARPAVREFVEHPRPPNPPREIPG